MKTFTVFMFWLSLVIPSWADDDLVPESLLKAIQKYDRLENSTEIDTMNHEVWKLYIYNDLSPKGGGDLTPKWLVAGLTPYGNRLVILQINQLYNYVRPVPKSGDVIVVEGYVKGHYNYSISTKNREFTLKALSMTAQGAMNLPKEHFEPNPSSTPTAAKGLIPTATPGGPGH